MSKGCCSDSWGQIYTILIRQCYQIDLLTSLVFILLCYSVILSQSEDLLRSMEKLKKTTRDLMIVIKGLFSFP